MSRIVLLVSLVCIFATFACGQVAEVAKVRSDQFLVVSKDYAIWQADGATKISVGAPECVPGQAEIRQISVSAARDEYEPFQLIISGLAEDTLRYENISFTDLKNVNGEGTIKSANFKTHLVGYIHDDDPGRILYPDVLFDQDEWKTIRKGENYNLWIVLYVPKDTPAGDYTGSVTLKVDGNSHTLPISVHVWDFTLPHHTNIWTQLWSIKTSDVAKWYDLDPWSKDYENMFLNIFEMFSRYRFTHGQPMPVPFSYFGYPPDWKEEGGIHGKYGRFNGIDDKILISLRHKYELKSTLSVEAWIRPKILNISQDIAGSFVGSFGGYRLRLNGRGELEFNVGICIWATKTNKKETLTYPYPDDGKWHHVAGTYDYGKTVLYLDGKAVAQKEVDFKRVGGQMLGVYIACGRWGNYNFFNGDMDDIRIFDKALTDKEIAEEMAATQSRYEPIIAYEFESDPAKLVPVNAYLQESVEYFDKWCKYWKDQGRYLGILNSPKSTKEDLPRFLKLYYPVIKKYGLEEEVYVRLPHDETYNPGPALDENINYGKIMREMAPGIRLHQTFGGMHMSGTAPEGQKPLTRLEALKKYDDLIDIWDITPYRHLGESEIVDYLGSRVEKGEKITWYTNANSHVKNYGNTFRVMLWQMQHFGISALNHWGTTLWHRPEKARQKEVFVMRERRGFGTIHSSGTGAGNGCFFWPGRDGPLPTIRCETIRDGIEDNEYCWVLKQLLEKLEQDNVDGKYDNVISETKAALTVNPDIIPMLYGDGGIRYPTSDDTTIIFEQRTKVAEQIEKVQKTIGNTLK